MILKTSSINHFGSSKLICSTSQIVHRILKGSSHRNDITWKRKNIPVEKIIFMKHAFAKAS
ncbi:hypothetical protein JCM19298_3400 [Nonlabens ulvanivorans]|nr:hypothetical protein JCM19298_3400 [Nonlabens ulvanivorans]